MLVTFGDIHSFLEQKDLPPTRQKLLDVMDDPPQNRKLKTELAVTIDAGEPFVKATYRLEGDGPLTLIVYEEISNLRASVSCEYYPNVVAVVTSLSSTPTHVDQLTKYAKSCVKPAYDYFGKKFTVSIQTSS